MNNCNGHGTCDTVNSRCLCYSGWGADTDIAVYKAPDCRLAKIDAAVVLTGQSPSEAGCVRWRCDDSAPRRLRISLAPFAIFARLFSSAVNEYALRMRLGWTFQQDRPQLTREQSAVMPAFAIAQLGAADALRALRARPANAVSASNIEDTAMSATRTGALACCCLHGSHTRFCPPLPRISTCAAVCFGTTPCSGHGKCVSMKQMALEPNAVPFGGEYGYGGLEVRPASGLLPAAGAACALRLQHLYSMSLSHPTAPLYPAVPAHVPLPLPAGDGDMGREQDLRLRVRQRLGGRLRLWAGAGDAVVWRRLLAEALPERK